MVRKENIVKCEECGRTFDNAYKIGWRRFGCTRLCARSLREKQNIIKNKERRHKLREEHKCIICGKNVKPIVIYHQCCHKHHKQNIEVTKKREFTK